MDIARAAQSIDPWTWTVPLAAGDARHEARHPLRQPRRCWRRWTTRCSSSSPTSPDCRGWSAPRSTMPDAHWGYGFPIGGVAAFDPEQGGIISAGGVGFDISCGIRCLRTNLTADDIAPAAANAGGQLLAARSRPASATRGRSSCVSRRRTRTRCSEAARSGRSSTAMAARTISTTSRSTAVSTARSPPTSPTLAKKRQRGEMGTLGSGNHYLEVQTRRAASTTRRAAEAFGLRRGQVVVSIHCGSRGLGHQIGTEYLRLAGEGRDAAGHHAARSRTGVRADHVTRGTGVPRRDERRDQLRARQPADPHRT